MAAGMQDNSPFRRLSRRAALLAPLALAGCDTIDGWFSEKKTPLPGKREPLGSLRGGLKVDEGVAKVVLPPAVRNAGWPQAGGNPAHYMGHLELSPDPKQAWSASIGDGGGYRSILTAEPVAADGVVYTMDSDANVSAWSVADGNRRWRFDTKDKKVDSTNIGGGISVADGTVYAANGIGDVVAIDAAKGEQKWRQNIGSPARSAPTIAEGRLFIITIDDRMVAMAASDGHALWSHRALGAVTSMLGRPAPTYGQGLVIGGFGSGALTALRADSGAVAWTDGLSGSRTRGTIDFLSVRGRPVISNGRVHAISVGGLVAALDLPTGRRLWERQIAGEDSPWVAGDWMFVVSMDQEVAAIDTREGRVAWVTPLPRWADPEKRKDSLTWFGPLLAGDRLVVTGRNEQALSISPYTGEILGRKDLSGAAAPSTPIVADGTLLILTDDARLIALR